MTLVAASRLQRASIPQPILVKPATRQARALGCTCPTLPRLGLTVNDCLRIMPSINPGCRVHGRLALRAWMEDAQV